MYFLLSLRRVRSVSSVFQQISLVQSPVNGIAAVQSSGAMVDMTDSQLTLADAHFSVP